MGYTITPVNSKRENKTMGDLAETFKLMKEHTKAKKLSNLEYSTKLLTGKGVEFESKNGGVHLIVSHNGITADFWPSTGKFQIRGKGYSRGVRNLLCRMGVK